MRSATLDEFTGLNDQLAALLLAGVPVDLGLAGTTAEKNAALREFNATVARRVSQGTLLNDALLNDERPLPPAYRSLMQLGLASGQFSAALDSRRRLAVARERSWQTVQVSLLYPLIICFLAYLGFIALCLYFVPTMEQLYIDLELQPGTGLRAIQLLRDTLPGWIAIPPLLLIARAVWRWRPKATAQANPASSARWLVWLTGTATDFQLECQANFAEATATLLEGDLPFSESLRIAADACGDPSLKAGAGELAQSIDREAPLADTSSGAIQFPPFLRWALWHSEETIGRARALRMAARLYRDAARRRAVRMRFAAPTVACVVLGGGVVLLYCLALFLPLVEMLKQLA